MQLGYHKRQVSHIVGTAITYFLVVAALVFMLTPIIWLMSTSLKSRSEMFTFPLRLIPTEFVWDNYVKIWQAIPFAAYLKNSLLMACYTTVIALAVSSLASYAFSRYRLKGKNTVLNFILFSQMFPAVLLIIPIFIYIKKAGLLGTYTGLMITYLTFVVPFATWAMKNFFDTIPTDLEEAAMIDGCTRIQAMRRIILPVSRPGLISVSTYCFLTAWNEFIFAMILMPDQTRWTLPVGLAALTSQYALDWGLLTAGGVISVVPAVLIMLVLQRYLIAGLMAGAIKE